MPCTQLIVLFVILLLGIDEAILSPVGPAGNIDKPAELIPVSHKERKCEYKCISFSRKCNEMKNDAPSCKMVCVAWKIACSIPDGSSSVISQIDDGTGGKNPFKPAECLTVCGEWNDHRRCIGWICNRLPQMEVTTVDGMKIERALEDVDCLGVCVKWDKSGACTGYRCSQMVPISSLPNGDNGNAVGRIPIEKNSPLARGWWDDVIDTAVVICVLFCG